MQISCHSNSRARQSRQLPFHLSSQHCTQPRTSSAGVWLFPFKGSVRNWGNYSIDLGVRGRKRGRQKELWERMIKRTCSWCLVRGSYSSKQITVAKIRKQAKDKAVSIGLRSKITHYTFLWSFCHCQSDPPNFPCSTHPKSSHFDYQV